ncbi:MAG TPA: 4'-phosphopantetheinyl transferase superfamily protein [Streptosporangiaceae bacterium]|nr:4'-phosphopantetheinyl transferase superfamily protein [Streptosporangiaceae bacterium]
MPSGRSVHVWWFDIRAVSPGAAGLASLDDGERERAAAFAFPADRHRYQVAHVMLRQVLARYTGTAAAGLAFGREPCPRCGGPSGRPVLVPPAGGVPVPGFSLAHSGDMVAIAVAGLPVGVDTEHAARGCVCSLATTLHPADAAWVAGLAEPARHEAIMTCWVRAEAVLKCTGEGIGHGLDGFEVRPVPGGGGPAAAAAVHGCAVREMTAPAGYRAAVALAGAGQIAVQTRRWT